MMAWWYRHTIVQESLAICIFFGPMKYHTTSKKNLKSHFETIVDHQRTRLYDCEGRLWTYSDKSGHLVWVINLPNTFSISIKGKGDLISEFFSFWQKVRKLSVDKFLAKQTYNM